MKRFYSQHETSGGNGGLQTRATTVGLETRPTNSGLQTRSTEADATMAIDRAAVEQLPTRGSFDFEIAEMTEDGDKLRVKGYANSFRPMRSGRVLSPKPYIKWAKGKGRTLTMLANHGYVPGFGSIGQWNAFSYDEKRGALMEGFIGSGTSLMNEARTLVKQGILRNISVGWTARQARWITIDDKDIDAHFKTVMEEDGVRECYAFIDYELVEASLVDVPDDPRATLAANTQWQMANGELLRALADLRASISAIQHASPEKATDGNEVADTIQKIIRETVRAEIQAALPEMTRAALELASDIAIDPHADYGAALLDAELSDSADKCRGHGSAGQPAQGRSEFGALIERVRRM